MVRANHKRDDDDKKNRSTHICPASWNHRKIFDYIVITNIYLLLWLRKVLIQFELMLITWINSQKTILL